MVDPLPVVVRTTRVFLDDVISALPRLLSGFIFLALAYVAVRIVLSVVSASTDRMYPADEALVGDLIVTVVAAFCWFAVALAFLNIVGMGDVAASLGTAVGFVALGVSYALSEMIEDTVAGVYLLRDPDFNIGYRVDVNGMTGTVASIELRKSRFDTDEGERVVLANRDIEGEWTLASEAAGGRGSTPDSALDDGAGDRAGDTSV